MDSEKNKEHDESEILELLARQARSQEDQKIVDDILGGDDPVHKKITEIKIIDKQAYGRQVSRRFNDFVKKSTDQRIRSNVSHIQNEVLYCLPGFQKDFNATYILLVDDLTYITKTVSYMLEKAGFQVFTAKNGLEALILFQRILPDLVITDIRLPDFNGFEIASFLRQSDDRVPIIFITAVDIDENIFTEIRGKKAFLQKPIKRDALLDTIKGLWQEQAYLPVQK